MNKTLTTQLTILELSKNGELQNAYTPLHNMVSESTHQIGDFTSNKLNFNKYNPVEMSVVDEYDGSTNIIINDDTNSPKLINNRFSVQENKTFEIPIHYGNAVTNIYKEKTLQEDTQLIKLYNKIPTLQYLGLTSGGSFKCGSYVFYFKLSDADGNLSNIVQESGIVQVHMGEPNTTKIRMGMANENAQKCIRFRLYNLDPNFDYIKIYYERLTTDESQAVVNQYFFIDQNFPIINESCDILLTGSESTIQIDSSELQTSFADISTAKTQAIVDNTLFLGNVSSYEQNYNELQQIAWRIIPEIVNDEGELGNINSMDYGLSNGGIYYNTKNSYEKVGYFNDEFYRFGIVFIYKNNLLSPVFNIQGCDLSLKITDTDLFEETTINNNGNKVTTYKSHSTEPSDGFFNKAKFLNSKGVVRLHIDKNTQFENPSQGVITHKPIGIRFNLKYIGVKEGKEENGKIVVLKDGTYQPDTSALKLLQSLNVKGFFFVRQKRIPTIISQGIVIGLTGRKFGSIPVIQNQDGKWITKSFISKQRLLKPEGDTVTITSQVTNNALLVPDYELNTASLNQIFNGTKFELEKIGNINFSNNGDHTYPNIVKLTSSKWYTDIPLTAVQRDTKIVTDGYRYFSSLAGDPSEPYKTSDVNHEWNRTPPQDLTVSTSLIRGKWGAYVGMGDTELEYGDIVNIRVNNSHLNESKYLDFQKRFNDNSFYSAISPRMEITEIFRNNITSTWNVTCYRGDCFMNMFTHRMMTNFIDPELPTNTQIIDPSCWCKNYAVRCTAEILNDTHSNLTRDSDGWYIPNPQIGSNIMSIILAVLTGNIEQIINTAKGIHRAHANNVQTEFANEVAQAFEIRIAMPNPPGGTPPWTKLETANGYTMEELVKNEGIKKVNPQEQEQGNLLKNLFKSDEDWELHGLASINRADVNAVSFGQWITFPICSSYNMALRDIDFTQATEEAAHNRKRSFYPLQAMNVYDHLLESDKINGAAKKSISSIGRPGYKAVPFIKEEFFNRIYWSKPNITQQFVNSYRLIFSNQFKEYNKEFGSITKLVPLGNSLIVIFEHGIGMMPVNRSPQTEAEASPWLSQTSVLPSQVQTLSADFGSMWKDSIIKTPKGFIYGVDTVAKKIWRIYPDGSKLEFISDFKVQKFLNDHITLSEYDTKEYQGHINVKTHYNAFKNDVMFTYYRDIPMDDNNVQMDIYSTQIDKFGNIDQEKNLDCHHWEKGEYWNLCFNEITNNFVTFYSWIPVESCNIDNIYFSFNRDEIDSTLTKSNKASQQLVKIEDDYTTYSVISKYDVDKAFTGYATMFTESSNNFIIDVPSGFNYFSFYVENTNGLIINEQIPQNIAELSTGWKFILFDVRAESQVSIVGVSTIVEPKFSKGKIEETTNPNWKYMNFRESDINKMFLWKHGQAGLYDNQDQIKPTNWYGKQHEWSFEFIVNESPQVQKIFNNLQIISNKAEPYKFEYEVIGEGYQWYIYKPIIGWINKHFPPDKDDDGKWNTPNNVDIGYKEVLSTPYGKLRKTYSDFPEIFGLQDNTIIQKLPYLKLTLTDYKGMYSENPDYWKNKSGAYTFNSSETAFTEDTQLSEYKVHTESLANDIKKYGRLRGNMEYKEDLWKVEVRPVSFKYAYISQDELTFTKQVEARHRDKFIRVKVRYNGKDLAVVQAVSTLFDQSFA